VMRGIGRIPVPPGSRTMPRLIEAKMGGFLLDPRGWLEWAFADFELLSGIERVEFQLSREDGRSRVCGRVVATRDRSSGEGGVKKRLLLTWKGVTEGAVVERQKDVSELLGKDTAVVKSTLGHDPWIREEFALESEL